MKQFGPLSLKRLLHTRWFYIVNLVLIIFVLVSFGREYIHSRDISAQIRSLQQQAQELQTQHLAISDLKQAVQTESYMEGEARLKLGLKKPGESVVILKDGSGARASTQTDKTVPGDLANDQDSGVANGQKSLANSTKWWYYFFDKQAFRAL